VQDQTKHALQYARCLPSICLSQMTQSSFHDARFTDFLRLGVSL
jgi:hypothetical protein